MAITKLSNIGMPKGGGAAHLKNCISYIMNPDKTEGMVGGNAGSGVNVIDRHGECRFMIIGVGGYHLREHELSAQLDAHRHADKALRVLRHEVHVFGGSELGSADEVTLVLTVGIVGA